MAALIARIVFYGVFVYFAVLAGVYLGQRSLQYFPDKSDPGEPAQYGLPRAEIVKTVAADGVALTSWFIPPKKQDDKIIVFFHGNAGHLGHRAMKMRGYADAGYGVFMAGYRGYGANRGRPTEEGFYHDARAALRAVEEKGYKASQIVIYGESIGSGVAVQMALEMQPQYVVLEAPFDSAASVARWRFPFLPVDFLMKDRFDSIRKIGDVKAALLFVHGDEDGVVPIRFGRRLYDAANHPKEFITINGAGHNDLYEHHAAHIIFDWLEKQAAPAAAETP